MVFLWTNIKQFIKVNSKIAGIVIAAIFFINISLPQAQANEMAQAIRQASELFQIDEDLIRNLIQVESSQNPRAISPRDARGLMQITRQTWDWICAEFLGQEWPFDAYAFDVEKNILVGTRFLRWIHDYLHHNKDQLQDEWIDLVVACYNAGPGAVRRHGFTVPPYAETQRYVEKIRIASGLPSAAYSSARNRTLFVAPP